MIVVWNYRIQKLHFRAGRTKFHSDQTVKKALKFINFEDNLCFNRFHSLITRLDVGASNQEVFKMFEALQHENCISGKTMMKFLKSDKLH